ncbi:MAG: uroporphyrinogen decarboxylase family protein [Armatimonadota bacterium]
MPTITVSLHFMPAFYTQRAGVTYGEAYYFDPGHRARVELAEGRLLHELFGRYSVGSPDPAPNPNLFIQPIDLLLRTQGARWHFPADGALESTGTPWAELTVAEIAAIDPRAAAEHPAVDEVLTQYRELQRLYGDAADILGTKSGTLNIHAPYTTAHQLCGEGLFMLMLEDPAGAQAIFRKVWELYRAVYARILAATGASPARLYLGDCSASLLSAETYGECVLPVNRELAESFPRTGYHSCGSSGHLLRAFAGIPRVDAFQLGPGTDLAAAAALFPGVILEPLIDPVTMREGNPADVQRYIGQVLANTAPAPAVTLCAWSFDAATPPENVAALYESVMDA